MARYIDADETIERIKNIKFEVYGPETVKAIAKSGIKNFRTTVIVDIINQPTADVAEVVRCKDSEYWQDNNNGYPHEECRCGKGETPDTDDYCSYGKKVE